MMVGRFRQYVCGHIGNQNHGKNHPNWRGGRRKDDCGYWRIFRPDHHQAIGGYLYEHRLKYEEHYKVCLSPWTKIHHKDGDKQNNYISNLLPVTASEHGRIHNPREDFGQVCGECGMMDLVNKVTH